MILSDMAVRHRTPVFVLIYAITLFGAISYVTLPRESAPDVPTPWVLVTTVNEGVSPEDIEATITRELEKELASVKGLKEMTSTSSEGVSVVQLEFQPDVRVEDALQYVRDKVDLAKGELPMEAEEPIIQEINIAEFPVMLINVSGTVGSTKLKTISDDLADDIESVPGVLAADVLGGLEREIRIEIDPDRVKAYGLTIDELVRLIPSENVNISAGGLETEGVKFNIRVPAEFEDPEEVLGLLLTVRNGKPIYLSSVATISDTFKDRVTYSRLDGQPSLTVSVQKRTGANIVDLASQVKSLINLHRDYNPDGVNFTLTYDQSEDIAMMVSDLENNILSGLVLVVAVLLLFLGLRTSLIVAFAIPMSMLISFSVIQVMGMTLNMVVLFSLILALGMLVDNAIVIVENVYRYRTMGYGRMEAAMKGTGEVAWPVISSTATTLAAFSPMLLWGGIMGEFMKYLPMTLIITLSSSLFVALIISPTICSLFGGGGKRGPGWLARKLGPITWPIGWVRRTFMGGYRGLLRTSLRNWFVTIPLAFLVLIAIAIIYGRRNHGVEFFPEADPNMATINIRMPQGTQLDETDRIARVIEQRVNEHLANDLEHVVANIGSAGGQWGGSSSGPHVGNIQLVFKDYEDRERPSKEALEEIRGHLTDIPGAELKVEQGEEGPPTGSPVTVRIIGKDLDKLEEISRRAKDRIATVPGLINLRSDLEATKPELVFKVDRRRATLLGVDPSMIGQYLKMSLFGREVSTYREYNDEYDITIRLPMEQRQRIEDVQRLWIPNRFGSPVALSSLGHFEYAPGLGTIHRVDQKRVVTLTADNSQGRPGPEVLADAQARLADMPLEPGYRLEYAGEKEEQDKAQAFLMKAGLAAVILILIILVLQFNTMSVPLIIMTTVLLSLIGVLVGLMVWELPFGIIMTGIGVISLAGVVVNNAIVLLDYTRQLQDKGQNVLDAAVEAGATRLRPVLLTATTTILGLIPMATGVAFDFRAGELILRSETSQWWQSMAVAVIFGLGFATLLTLLFVPTMYVPIYRFLSWLGWGGLEGEEPVHEHKGRVLADY